MGKKRLTRITDLKPQYEDFTIVNSESGEEVVLRLRPLTAKEIAETTASIKRPKPKVTGFQPYKDEFGRPVPIYDDESPEYRKAINQANRDLVYAWLLASAELEVPGDTPEERRQALDENIPNWAFLEIQRKLNEVLGYTDSDVAYQKKKLPTVATESTNSASGGAGG